MPLLPFQELPYTDPGSPDLRSPFRFLLWTGRKQKWMIGAGVVFGVIWMLSQALLWTAVGAAVDHGLEEKNFGAVARWGLLVVLLGVVQGVSGAIRHQFAVTNWLRGTFRSIQLVGRHLSTVTTAATEAIPVGDIVGTVAMDAMRVGGAFDVIPRFIGAVVSWLVVSAILLTTSVKLGLLVLIGVPVLASLTRPLMRPLHERQRAQREVSGKLAALGSDTVAGLRILRGVGGEDVFLSNYVAMSRQVEQAGVEVSKPQSALESGQILLPAILTAVVTYVGANDVMNGNLQAGQLVAFFGYATFLTTPLRTVIEFVIAGTRAIVGARKVLAILAVPPPQNNRDVTRAWPTHAPTLSDPDTGIEIRRGVLYGLVTETTAEAAIICDRLGRFTESNALIGTVPLADVALEEVRTNIVVSEIEPHLFSGSLRDELDPHGVRSEAEIYSALTTASAMDVLDASSDGLATIIEERGRSFSGGQRQRLTLARALLMDPEFLLLVEPTSAVDTHTEGRIARELRDARVGGTTVIATSSPLLLEKVDEVIVVRAGRVVDHGSHEQLLLTNAWYRQLIVRGDE